jgi:hypothetical protein
MNILRHFRSVFAALLALCGPALAGDIELYSTGTNDTLAFRIKNTSEKMRYVVFLEVKRVDLKSGDVISSRTDQHTLSPMADIDVGPARQQGAEVKYRIANVRLVNQPQARSGPRDASLPAPYPVMFKGR